MGRVRPVPEGEYDAGRDYRMLSIVYSNQTNKSYISKQDVPAGINIDNKTYWQVFGNGKFVDNAIINVSYLENSIVPHTLAEAISMVAEEDRRPGIVLAFFEKESNYDEGNAWILYQFKGSSIDDWDKQQYWTSVYNRENKFKGWFLNSTELVERWPNPFKGDYAYVGQSLNNSWIWRCNDDGSWSRTSERFTNNAIINYYGDITNNPDFEDIDVDEQNRLKFANREPNENEMGYVILRKDKTFAEQVTKENTIYEIRYNFVIDENITIPENCVLKFEGGSINGNNTLIGNNTGINAGLVKIFNTDIIIAGTWNVAEAYPEWFGAKGDGIIDDTTAINKIILSDISPNIVFTKHYNVSETINISKAVTLKGYNTKGYYNLLENIHNSKISTVNDIEIFVIATGGCSINGIIFEGNNNSGSKSLIKITASNNSISYCNFSKSYIGLLLQQSGIHCISYNNFTQCSIGCKSVFGGDCSFIGNYFNTNGNDGEFENCGIGLFLQTAGNTSVIGGKVEWNDKGIVIYKSSGVVINGVQFDKNKYGHIFLDSDTIQVDSTCRGTVINSCRFLGTREENSQHIWINYWNDTTIICVGNSFAYSGSREYDGSPASSEDVSTPSTIFNIKENHEYPEYVYKCKIYFGNNAINWVTNLATISAYDRKLVEFYTDIKLPVLGTGATFIGRDIYYKYEEVKSGVNINIYKINGTVSIHIYGTATETFQNYNIYPEFVVTDGNNKVLYDPNPGSWDNYIALIADTNRLLTSLENGHTVDIYIIVATSTSY